MARGSQAAFKWIAMGPFIAAICLSPICAQAAGGFKNWKGPGWYLCDYAPARTHTIIFGPYASQVKCEAEKNQIFEGKGLVEHPCMFLSTQPDWDK